ncbi:unnamed protein product [Scytosiphon promiscuus]
MEIDVGSLRCMAPSLGIPSHRHYDPGDVEDSALRLDWAKILFRAGYRLRFPQETTGTAVLLFHRFLIQERVGKHRRSRDVILTTCLFLAGKVTEAPRRLRDVINVLHMLTRAQEEPPLLDKAYWTMKERIVEFEQVLLRTINFQVDPPDPYRLLLNYARSLRLGRAATRTAWGLANDVLFCPRALSAPPPAVACAAIRMAARVHGSERRLRWFSPPLQPKKRRKRRRDGEESCGGGGSGGGSGDSRERKLFAGEGGQGDPRTAPPPPPPPYTSGGFVGRFGQHSAMGAGVPSRVPPPPPPPPPPGAQPHPTGGGYGLVNGHFDGRVSGVPPSIPPLPPPPLPPPPPPPDVMHGGVTGRLGAGAADVAAAGVRSGGARDKQKGEEEEEVADGGGDSDPATLPWWVLFDARDEEVELVCSELLALYRRHSDGTKGNDTLSGKDGVGIDDDGGSNRGVGGAESTGDAAGGGREAFRVNGKEGSDRGRGTKSES